MVEDLAVALKRAAGRHDVVEDEAAFVHLGQQIGAEALVGEVCAGDEQEADERPAKAGGRVTSSERVRCQCSTRPRTRAGLVMRSCAEGSSVSIDAAGFEQ